MKLQTISFRRGKGSRSAMKMGLKTTRLISFSRRVAVISTPTPLKRTNTRICTIVHLHDSLHPMLLYFSTQKHFTCIHDRMLKQARKHLRAFHTRKNVVEERTYIKCVYVLDGMRASRAAKWGCHLNKCLISPTSWRPLCTPGNILSVLLRVLARFFFPLSTPFSFTPRLKIAVRKNVADEMEKEVAADRRTEEEVKGEENIEKDRRKRTKSFVVVKSKRVQGIEREAECWRGK